MNHRDRPAPGAAGVVTVRVPRTIAGVLREAGQLMRNPSLLVWSLFVFMIPFYVFASGLPQPGDLLVIPLAVIALRPWNGQLDRTARRPVSALIAFTAWVIVVDWGWALVLGNFGLVGPDTFLLFPAYYVYNTLVFLIVCVLYQRYGARFLWLTLNVVLLSVVVQTGASFVVHRRAALRGIGFFNNPPLPFATTCYPRVLHDKVGGDAGGRLVNPDKYFLWQLLSVADTIYAIDHPLFDYRVHDAGQGPQEQRSGALKHLTDPYVATFNLPASVLGRAGLDREALAAAFIEQDIALRGLVALASGHRATARRGVHFGIAAYPGLARANPKIWGLCALLALGPAGTLLARAVRERIEQRWQTRESRLPREG